jgi:hypothetical protein
MAKTPLRLRRFSTGTYEVCGTFLRKTQVKSLTERKEIDFFPLVLRQKTLWFPGKEDVPA